MIRPPPAAIRPPESPIPHRTPGMTLREDAVVVADLPSRFAVVSRAPFVVALATVEPDGIVFVRQFRYAVQRWLWELPQGGCQAGEQPIAAAERETAEETGWLLSDAE